jgi:hypothetical protein
MASPAGFVARKRSTRRGQGYLGGCNRVRKNAVFAQISQRNMWTSDSSSGIGHTLTITIAAPHFSHTVVVSVLRTCAMLHYASSGATPAMFFDI